VNIWVSVEQGFSSAHRLVGHPRCGNIHVHYYKVRVSVLVNHKWLDFFDLKETVRKVVSDFDHKLILDKNDFIETSTHVVRIEGAPTTENIAKHLYRTLSRILRYPVKIRLYESDSTFVEVE